MYLVDANFFLEILLGRLKGEDCCKFLDAIKDGTLKAITTGYAIHSMELVMLGHGKKKELEGFMKYLVTLDNLDIWHTTLTDELKILQLMEKLDLDLDDCIQYYVAKMFKAEAIISFDKDFDGLDIPRIEPKDVV